MEEREGFLECGKKSQLLRSKERITSPEMVREMRRVMIFNCVLVNFLEKLELLMESIDETRGFRSLLKKEPVKKKKMK